MLASGGLLAWGDAVRKSHEPSAQRTCRSRQPAIAEQSRFYEYTAYGLLSGSPCWTALLGISAESGGGGKGGRPLALISEAFSAGSPYPQTVPQFWTRFCTSYIDSPFAAPIGAALLLNALSRRASA